MSTLDNPDAATASTAETVDLHKAFGSTRAVDGVDLSLHPGVTGLLGPNGAGKTTLLRMLATVLAPDRGRLRVLAATGHPVAISPEPTTRSGSRSACRSCPPTSTNGSTTPRRPTRSRAVT
jgi:ABC-type branched-subunit amino acid transport system ATPase component